MVEQTLRKLRTVLQLAAWVVSTSQSISCIVFSMAIDVGKSMRGDRPSSWLSGSRHVSAIDMLASWQKGDTAEGDYVMQSLCDLRHDDAPGKSFLVLTSASESGMLRSIIQQLSLGHDSLSEFEESHLFKPASGHSGGLKMYIDHLRPVLV
jgi:hypothetical protein